MSFLKFLGAVINNRLKGDTKIAPERTPTPLGLHQGSIVTLPDVELALAQVDGSIVQFSTGNQIVTSVGVVLLFGKTIYNVYLGDGTSFVQLVCKNPQTVEQVRLFVSRAEIVPQTQEDWEFWLGSWQRDSSGQFVRDANGLALRKDWGLIGWNQFQVDGNPPLVYDRVWTPGPQGVEAVSYGEELVSADGTGVRVEHEGMEYWRFLDEGKSVESLLVCTNSLHREASISVWIGIKLDPAALKILPA